MDTLGIYISVPFCRSKCSYCNFASGVHNANSLDSYVRNLVADIRGIRSQLSPMDAHVPNRVDSIYLGGGTPSVVPPALLQLLFVALRDEFEVSQDAEVTVECAPGQAGDDFLQAARDAGVNRLSFGVQSFVDREAAVTGRLHNREIALNDLRRAREAGIGRLNVDLIAGLPSQSAASWNESLQVLAETGVTHSSVYMLEVDEDSRLGRELLAGGGRYHADSVPSDDQIADFYLAAVERLTSRGLKQYEISNFALPGFEAIHNEKYWLRKPYLGFGTDAHSMLRTGCGGALRFETSDNLDDYLAGQTNRSFRLVPRCEELEEAWFLGLRRSDGVSPSTLNDEFGEAANLYHEVIAGLAADGLMEWMGDTVRLTREGQLMSNEVFARFLQSDRSEPEPALEII